MRSFGYSLNTAISDLIDNSITAKASNVWIDFEWDDEKTWISISDDGIGMDEEKLKNAMKIGSQSPLLPREKNDLGRFGLGLKSASFSQSQVMTVITKTESSDFFARTWDINFVQKEEEWIMGVPDADEDKNLKKRLKKLKSGTTVYLQELDGLDLTDKDTAKRHFFIKINELKEHLETYFHRFLSKNNFKIIINDNELFPWDPFLEGLSEELDSEEMHNDLISIKSYILPHKDSLKNKNDIEKRKKAEGIKGWQHQQGFYIYRNERLIVNGEWLGNENPLIDQQLGRIKVDIPNSLDREWEVDVMKSKITPKGNIRDSLDAIGKKTKTRASEVYRSRGKRNISIKEEIKRVWIPSGKNPDGSLKLKINRDHPLIKSIYCEDVELALKVIEDYVPRDQIAMDVSSNIESFGGQNIKEEELKNLINNLYKVFTEQGDTKEKALEKIKITEPATDAFGLIAIFEEGLNA